jgi:hypothetical protein
MNHFNAFVAAAARMKSRMGGVGCVLHCSAAAQGAAMRRYSRRHYGGGNVGAGPCRRQYGRHGLPAPRLRTLAQAVPRQWAGLVAGIRARLVAGMRASLVAGMRASLVAGVWAWVVGGVGGGPALWKADGHHIGRNAFHAVQRGMVSIAPSHNT